MTDAGARPDGTESIGPITHRRVLRIAVPILLANVTVPVLGAVDTGVVGQMGQAAPIGAVGLGAIVLSSVYWVFGFLRMGTTGLVAQAEGAGDRVESGAILIRALLIAAAAGLVLIAGQAALMAAAFAVAPASPEVEALARDYLAVRIWGAPAAIGLYALTGWLIATERTRAVLLLQLWINGLNIGLDLWFVLGLGWGVQGVAVATLAAEWSGLALGLWLARPALARAARASGAQVFDRARLLRMGSVNADIMLRSVLLQGSFTAFVFLGAGFGDVTLAANQILLQFLGIMAYALDGFAFAAEALVGQAVGRRSLPALRRAALMASGWGVAGALAMAAGFALTGPAVIDLMATAPEVREAARGFLPWVVAGAVLSLASYMLDGIFIGATATRAMRNAMLISVAVYAGAVAALVPAFGNHGLWAALLVLNVVRALTLAARYPQVERRAA